MQLDQTGCRLRNGDLDTANFDCIIPGLGRRAARRRPGGPRSTGTASSAAPPRSPASPQRTSPGEHGIVFCATDEIGMSQAGRPSRVAALEGPLPVPGAPRPPPAGPAQRALPGPADDQPERVRRRARPSTRTGRSRSRLRARHQPALLQRQQPGRDHGRCPDRGRARLHPRLARRAGDELLGAAASLGRLRPLRPGLAQPSYTERDGAPAAPRPDPDALGPRRPERLRAPDDRRSAAEHARRTRC